MSEKKDDAGTQPEMPLHWSLMKEFDEDMYVKVTNWRQCINKNEILPPKAKELMMVAMCCVTKNAAGKKTHSQFALEKGATKEELFATAAQSMLIGGIPAYRDAIMALKEILQHSISISVSASHPFDSDPMTPPGPETP
jgi:alkylhydroperoxidase/carboxymuconolactone decarboxylase family protein YurZ